MTSIDWDNIDPDGPEAQHLMENFKIRLLGYSTGRDAPNIRGIFLGRNDCIVIEPNFTDTQVGFTISISGLSVTEDNIRDVAAEQLGLLADLLRDDLSHFELKTE